MVAVSGNFGSFDALLNFDRALRDQSRTINRLSNGLRIQSASDDPTGLAVSNRLQGEVRAMRQLRRTQFDGISTIQLADDTLGTVINSLTRAVELATQAASDTLGGDNTPYKQAIDREYQELLLEIDQINNDTRINDVTLFGPGGTSIVVDATITVADATEQVTITTSSFSTTVLNLNGTDMNTQAGANTVLERAKQAIDTLSRQRGRLGALQGRLERNLSNIDDQIVNLRGIEGEIRDADVAEETVALTQAQILRDSNLAVIAQTNLSAESVAILLS